MTRANANVDTMPRGPRRQWLPDWAGCLILLVGATAPAVAFVFLHDVWRWAVAGVLMISGAVIWITADPGAASRRRRPGPDRES